MLIKHTMSGHGKVYDVAVLHSGTTLAINMRISYLLPATNLYKHGSWSAVTNQPDNIFKRFIEKEALTYSSNAYWGRVFHCWNAWRKKNIAKRAVAAALVAVNDSKTSEKPSA